MSFAQNSIQEIFANKNDQNYIEIKSDFYFLEMFVLSDTKCTGIKIPNTILVENGESHSKCHVY